MPAQPPSRGGIILATFLAAMVLRIIPWPDGWGAYNPDWVLLALIYWCIALPDRVGIGVAWSLGLLCDVLGGKILGQQALVYTMVAYLCLKIYQRLRLHPVTQQTLAVLGYLLFAQLLNYWILNVKGLGPIEWDYWLSSVFGAAAWPLVFLSLRYLRRAFQVL
ncbi:rod shape-determining protein MreD [Methylogaea oryzae]|uniref:Rod shape-determining protein MreD n=1 Tax=Methylogaea oryzae TaxID=1295382 RepID=A0A8D4VKM8_9GAMM|nr:rod shape-determining protein MreD [Methylogaea oryzae]BBL69863.1 rod shape-determining protein MreD [Methylogaea oryzae]